MKLRSVEIRATPLKYPNLSEFQDDPVHSFWLAGVITVGSSHLSVCRDNKWTLSSLKESNVPLRDIACDKTEVFLQMEVDESISNNRQEWKFEVLTGIDVFLLGCDSALYVGKTSLLEENIASIIRGLVQVHYFVVY